MNKNFTRVSLVAGSALVLVGQAHAALPAEITTALTEMKDNGLIIAGAVLLAVIAFGALKMLRKAF
jgi:hypothetical protein